GLLQEIQPNYGPTGSGECHPARGRSVDTQSWFPDEPWGDPPRRSAVSPLSPHRWSEAARGGAGKAQASFPRGDCPAGVSIHQRNPSFLIPGDYLMIILSLLKHVFGRAVPDEFGTASDRSPRHAEVRSRRRPGRARPHRRPLVDQLEGRTLL